MGALVHVDVAEEVAYLADSTSIALVVLSVNLIFEVHAKNVSKTARGVGATKNDKEDKDDSIMTPSKDARQEQWWGSHPLRTQRMPVSHREFTAATRNGIFSIKRGNHLDPARSNRFSGIFSGMKVPVLG